MRFDLKLMIVIIAVVIVAAVGSAYVTSWMFSSRVPVVAGPIGPAPAREDSVFQPELVWNAGEFTVNLATATGRSQFMKTSMSFSMNERESVAEIERRRVQVRDRIITILRTTSVDQFSSAEGFDELKQRIAAEVNELIVADGARVREVYLTELVIQ